MQCVICKEEIPPQYEAGQWIATGYECGECGQKPICEDCIENGFCDGNANDFFYNKDFPAEIDTETGDSTYEGRT